MIPKRYPNFDMTKHLETALTHYANVHRGCGHRSQISTALYEEARQMVGEYLGCKGESEVVFCSPFRLRQLQQQFGEPAALKVVTSADVGLPIGLCAAAVPNGLLKKKSPALPGGGTVKLVSKRAVVWADGAERFEAGTPHIFGAIAMAYALMQKSNDALNPIGASPPTDSSASPNQIAAQILLSDSLVGLHGRDLLFALQQTMLSDASSVPTSTGEARFVNFDYAASTPTFSPIWDAVRAAWSQSVPVQKAMVEHSRWQIRQFFGATDTRFKLHFAANTTEAIHLAAMGFRPFGEDNEHTVIVNTELEHNSNELIWRTKTRTSLVRLHADADGFVSLPELEALLTEYNVAHRFGKKRIRLVCVTAASNVMGSCNDLKAISRLVHRFGAHLLVDAAQAAAHRTLRMEADKIDFLAFSGHKMYAPFGSGGLIARKELFRFSPKMNALIAASGEQNVLGIVAMGKSVDLFSRIGMNVLLSEERRLTVYALSRLAALPEIEILGIREVNHPRISDKGGVICFEMAGVPHNLLAARLSEQGGIAVRSGCFCVNLYVKKQLGIGPIKNFIAHVGLATTPKFTQRLLTGVVRVSFGIGSTESDVDTLVETLKTIAAEPHGWIQKWLAKERFGTPFVPKTDVSRRIDALVNDVASLVFRRPKSSGSNVPV